jgi:hypothetical protein
MENNIDLTQKITSEEMRKNWNQYFSFFDDKGTSYEAIWISWCEKFSIDKNDHKVKLLYNFISNNTIPKTKKVEIEIIENIRTLIIKGLSGDQRYRYHVLCDNIGLYHESVTEKFQRHLHITKPDI